MIKCLVAVCLLGLAASGAGAFMNYPRLRNVRAPTDTDPGEPLFLTPLIEAGKIPEAQNKSRADFAGFKNITSHAGYLTIDAKANSNLFFWYFPALSGDRDAPTLLWLQGGPGASSLLGLFTENGPYVVKTKHGLKLRKYTWIQDHNVVYFDNPVGTGFSFTDHQDAYVRNETQVGDNMYAALVQFFTLFPEIQHTDFFVCGESYGGKYVPAVSHAIHRNNPTAALKIKLRGAAIGNGLSDPVHQLDYGDYLLQLGLIDSAAHATFTQYTAKGVACINRQDWKCAQTVFEQLINGDFNSNTLFYNATGFTNYYNYLRSDGDKSMDLVGKYLSRGDVRKAIHVGNRTFNQGNLVEDHLRDDLMQSVAPWVSQLLDHYRVLVYNGQLDIIVAYPMTVNYLQNLKFSGADEYKLAKRYKWKVDGQIAGYAKVAGNLTELLVRNAGHMVPSDQPKWALDLITRFARNKPFY